jgi:hypothetical protein
MGDHRLYFNNWGDNLFQDPVDARVPNVPAATYCLVRNYAGFPPPREPHEGADLWASLTVLPTASTHVPTGVPTVKVSPSNGLAEGQEVRVTLSGFGRSSLVHLSECAFARLATSNGCPTRPGRGQAVQMGASGSATTIRSDGAEVRAGILAPAQDRPSPGSNSPTSKAGRFHIPRASLRVA